MGFDFEESFLTPNIAANNTIKTVHMSQYKNTTNQNAKKDKIITKCFAIQ